jgi:hypothetical protein
MPVELVVVVVSVEAVVVMADEGEVGKVVAFTAAT